MKYKLSKFLTRNFLKLYSCGIPLQEIVALHFNLRPLVRIGVSRQQLNILEKVCAELKFKLSTMKSYGPNKNNPLLFMSKSEEKLKEYHVLEEKYVKKQVESLIMGQYLGYPICCIKEFKKNTRREDRNNDPVHTLLNTKGKLNFHLNYLYSFESRKFNYKEYNRISSSYQLNNMCLIPHIPCSFNCENSIKYAQKLLNIIEINFPMFYKKILFFLRKPILYFNDFMFFPLIGKIDNGSLIYHNFIKIHAELPIRIIKLLEKGNLIKEENNSLQIYKDGYYIKTLSSDVKLFNFE